MRILPQAQRDAMYEIYNFCRCVDDIAVVSNIATVTETTPDAQPITYTVTQILRRQPDGGWLHILDDPFFG